MQGEHETVLSHYVTRHRRLLEELPAFSFSVDRDRVAEVLAHDEAVTDLEVGRRIALGSWDDPLGRRVDALLDRAFAGGEVREELPWRGGWWEVWLAPLVDAEGTVTEVLGLVIDVTSQHRSAELAARLTALFDSTRIGIVATTPEAVVTHWNRGAARLFGWTAEEATGRALGDLIETGTSDRSTVAGNTQELSAGRFAEPYVETTRRHKAGHEVRVGLTLSTIRGVGGEILGASAIYQDLSERHRVASALSRSEEQFRALAENVQDVIYRVDVGDGPPRLEYVSPVARTVLGVDHEALVREPSLLLERMHPADAGNVLRSTEDVVQAGSGPLRWRWRHRDGHWLVMEDRRSVLEEDGHPVAIVGVVRDVTEEHEAALRTQQELASERRISERLRHLDEMRTVFLSAVSHELRTPLTSVVGFAETAVRAARDVEAEALSSYLDRLLVNARRLEELMDDLLDVDRLSRGKVTPERRTVDLATLVRRVIHDPTSIGHRVETDLESVELAVDPVMIERVVENLVRNAERHTPAGTSIWVRVAAVVGGASIVVEDDGPGVRAEDRDRLFEPFQQGRDAWSDPSPGTGIGLSLVRWFTEIHGGTVVIADRPGGGARFAIFLPAVD